MDKFKNGLLHTVEIFHSSEDEGYIAFSPELPGCSAYGSNRKEALKNVEVAMKLWIYTARKEKREIPSPDIYAKKWVL